MVSKNALLCLWQCGFLPTARGKIGGVEKNVSKDGINHSKDPRSSEIQIQIQIQIQLTLAQAPFAQAPALTPHKYK